MFFMFIFSCLYFQKTFSCFYFHFFFNSNARKSCALFIDFVFLHEIFLQGKILPLSPLSSTPHPNQKNPLKTSVHFPITITVCKHWSKFVTCRPSPRDCGGVSHSQIHSYYSFCLCGTKWLSQNFDLLTLEEKWAWGGAWVPSNFLVT